MGVRECVLRPFLPRTVLDGIDGIHIISDPSEETDTVKTANTNKSIYDA